MYESSKLTQRIVICLIVLFALIIGFDAVTTLHINGDEAIIGEHSYRLVHEGNVRSEMFTGMGQGWEVRQLHFHKLFVLLGAASIQLFGVSIIPLRAISLLSAFALFYLLTRYIKQSGKDGFALSAMVSILFLFSFRVFSLHAFMFRPEVLVSTLGFASFFLIWKANGKLSYVALGGLVAGLAASTHLNGLAYIASGFAILAATKRYKPAIVFCLASLAGLSVYFFDIRSMSELSQMLSQLAADPNLDRSHFAWYAPLLRVLDEHMRFFHNPAYVSMSLLFIFSLVANFKQLKQQHGMLIGYLMFLVIFLAMITHGPLAYYIMIDMPFIALVVGLSCEEILSLAKPWRIGYLSLAVLFVACQLTFTIMNIDFKNDVQTNNEISAYLPPNSKILSRECSFFNEGERNDIRIFMALELKHRDEGRDYPTGLEFLNFAKQYGNDYIVLKKNLGNRQTVNAFEKIDFSSPEIKNLCNVVADNPSYYILKINK